MNWELGVQGHYSAVSSLCLAPDGWTLLSAGRDKVVNVWDLRKNTKLVTVPVYEALEGDSHLPSLLHATLSQQKNDKNIFYMPLPCLHSCCHGSRMAVFQQKHASEHSAAMM